MERECFEAFAEPDLTLSLDSLQDSDSESLTQEMEYQSVLQRRICQHEDCEEEPEPDLHGSLRHPADRSSQSDFIRGERAGDADLSLEDEHNKPSLQKCDTFYSDLRYDPDWKRKRTSGAAATCQDPEEFSDDSLSGYCTSPKTLKNKQSDDRVNIRAAREKRPPADPVRRSSDVSAITGPKTNKRESTQSKTSPKDIIEKNKHTLGVRGPRAKSYLQLYRKNADEDASVQDQKRDSQSGKEEVGHALTKGHPKSHSSPHICPRDTERSNRERQHSILAINTFEENPSGLRNLPGLTAGFSFKHRISGSPPGTNSEHLYEGPMGMNYGVEVPPLSYPRPSDNQGYSFKSQTVPDSQSQSVSRYLRMDWQDVLEPPHPSHRMAEFHSEVLDKTIPARAPGRQQAFYPNALNLVLHGTNDYLLIDAEGGGNEENSFPNSEQDSPKIIRNPQMDKAQTQKLINLLKQEVKLGGIGPSCTLSKEKEDQIQKQKVYAKLIQERNRELKQTISKAAEFPIQLHDSRKCVRQKRLEYAMKIPKPQTLPKINAPCRKEETPRAPVYLQDVSPQLQRIQQLQLRHEREKVAVAAFNALHIL